MAWDLFTTFFMIGFVSFGGGYAMIPLIQEEVVIRHGWLTLQQFSDIIAVAGMSPGPISTNSAIMIGYQQLGIWGATVSAIGMTLPSLLIILIVATIFYKINENTIVNSALYGLRSVITGLIIYVTIIFAVNNGVIAALSWHTISLMLIFLVSLLLLFKFKMHPIFVIVLSGLVGIALYS